MNSKEFWQTVWADVLANTASGILIAFLALISIDQFYATPQLGGMWEFTIEVDDTTYSDYKQMQLTYQAVLLQKELQFSGAGDKYAEKSLPELVIKELSGEDRVPITLSGYIEKNFFSDNKVFISISEQGSLRISATFHELSIESDDLLTGTFYSTIANTKGRVSWRRVSEVRK